MAVSLIKDLKDHRALPSGPHPGSQQHWCSPATVDHWLTLLCILERTPELSTRGVFGQSEATMINMQITYSFGREEF